jgi:ubiquinone/menaquinone biosynthesis C-methylase UbiE
MIRSFSSSEFQSRRELRKKGRLLMLATQTNRTETTTHAPTHGTETAHGNVTPERIMQFAWGFTIPLMIEAAVRNRLFDALDKGPKTLDQLCHETNTSPRGVRMVCNALVGVDLLRKHGERYSLSPESQNFLVTGKPGFQGGIFKHISTQLIPGWLNLEQIVKTGKPTRAVNQQGEGAEFFQQFVEDIFPMSYQAAQKLAEELRLPESRTPISVLDIAAGSGVWGIALAEKSLQVRVRAVDWEKVLPVTKRVAKRHNVADRFTFVPGDLATADLGSNHHVATLGHIIHSEGEQKSRELIKRIYDALAPGGTIAIAEWTPNDHRTGPANALIFAVNMLVNTDEGDTYTFNEIRTWLEQAGFMNVRQLEAPAPSPLILATKPGR